MAKGNLLYNYGIYTKGKYTSRYKGKHTKEYNIWVAMISRCYNSKIHKKHPSYKDCSVCDDWLIFQNFAEWFNNNYIENYQLDKDILIQGNKIYSPTTCCFVPQEINLSVIKPMNKRKYPTGVYKHSKKFVVHIKENKVSKYICIFDTIEDASDCYINEKEKQLIKLAEKYRDTISINLYNTLLNYKVNLKNSL